MSDILAYTSVMEAISVFSRLLNENADICTKGIAWWEDGRVILWIDFNEEPDESLSIKPTNISLNTDSEKMRQDSIYYFVCGYCSRHNIKFTEAFT